MKHLSLNGHTLSTSSTEAPSDLWRLYVKDTHFIALAESKVDSHSETILKLKFAVGQTSLP